MTTAARIDYRRDFGDEIVFDGVPFEDTPAKPEKNYGTRIVSGPMGSGKTLLAVRMSHPWAMRPDCWDSNTEGISRCGRPYCLKQWKVYTNLKSTERWAQPLNIVQQMKAGNHDINHAIIIGDEIHQAVDSRRSMRNENIDIGTTLTLIRKRSVIVWLTTQSINKIDTRIRDEAARFYDVWSPDGGRHVKALRYDRADGSVPPWERGMNFKGIGTWYTAPYRHLYNTDEIIDMAADFEANRRETQIIYRTAQGGVNHIAENGAIYAEALRLVGTGQPRIDASDIAIAVFKQWRHAVNPDVVMRILIEKGLTWDKTGALEVGQAPAEMAA